MTHFFEPAARRRTPNPLIIKIDRFVFAGRKSEPLDGFLSEFHYLWE
jgi:hypothetical protein